MDTTVFEKQLRSMVEEFNAMKAKSQHKDLSDLPKSDRQALVTRAISAVHRISGQRSPYSRDIDRLLKTLVPLHEHMTSIMGVAQALLDDLQAGYLRSLVEIVHADIFSDFLKMAWHLCDSGYKDAAAVIAGSTLESHVRELCNKAGIPLETTKPNGDKVPKNADTMNANLAADEVYGKLDQKNVTAWLGLRNKAAHGEYDEYSKEQVVLLISNIRDFIARNPA